MTKQQKLTKVIERAVERGFDMEHDWSVSPDTYEPKLMVTKVYPPGAILNIQEKELLFNHDFAKAYFGDDPSNLGTSPILDDRFFSKAFPAWQYHLMRAVLSKDPIDYYYKNK